MNLTDTTHSLEIVTSAAQSLKCSASWTAIDKSGSATVATPGSNSVTVSTATTTTLVAAPGASVSHAISQVSCVNTGAAANTVTVQRDIGGTEFPVTGATLAVGESLQYERGRGWYVLTASGEVSTVGATGADGADGANAVTEVEVDFGASSTDVATLVVSDAGIGTGSVFLCGITGGSTTDNNADAHALMAHVCKVTAAPSAGSVTFTARLYGIRATGKFKLRYVYS